MELSKFEQQILKTGFELEYRVASSLKSAGWSVISNKYYLDEDQEEVREIDLIGYKVSKIQHMSVYTGLTVSCKKSAANIWALLCRDVDVKDRNSDWWPLHTWTNDMAVDYQLSRPNTAREYHTAVAEHGIDNVLCMPRYDVFAFQEMNRETGTPQNDKPIFTAITSLMKAQAYELSKLPGRRKNPSVYQFNLISVSDTELVRLRFDPSGISAGEVEEEQYIARYIVNKEETFSRIHFVTPDAFVKRLDDYGNLHALNCQWISRLCDDFYKDVLHDWPRTEVLLKNFGETIAKVLNRRVASEFDKQMSFEDTVPMWSDEAQRVDVCVPAVGEVLAFLNNDQASRMAVSGALKSIYRYYGDFAFA